MLGRNPQDVAVVLRVNPTLGAIETKIGRVRQSWDDFERSWPGIAPSNSVLYWDGAHIELMRRWHWP